MYKQKRKANVEVKMEEITAEEIVNSYVDMDIEVQDDDFVEGEE